MTFYVENEADLDLGLDYKDIFETVALEVLKQEECPYEVEISLTLVNPDVIRSTNKEFRNIDCVTDVLSFPMLEYDNPADFSNVESDFPDSFNPESGELMLGDIMICCERAREQAKERAAERKSRRAKAIEQAKELSRSKNTAGSSAASETGGAAFLQEKEKAEKTEKTPEKKRRRRHRRRSSGKNTQTENQKQG